MESVRGHTEKNTAIMVLEPTAEPETFQRMRERLDRFVAAKIRHIIFDLCSAEYVNSSVLAVLVDLKKRCQKEGLSFTLVNVTGKVRAILRTTKLESFLLPGDGAL